MESCEVTSEDILKRLKKVEGQVKGIQKMVQQEQYCGNVLIQIAAVRAALNKVGGIILENHSKVCIYKAIKSEDPEKEVNKLMNTMLKFIK